MSFTLLSIDLKCHKKHEQDQPAYRLWLDGRLIVERRFWPSAERMIQEQLTFSDDDQDHCISLENVTEHNMITVQSVKSYNGDDLEKINPDDIDLHLDCNSITFKTPKR